MRRYADHYNTQTIKQYLAGDRKVRQWVIMAAKELGLTTTTEGGSNLSMNLTLMQDGYPGLEHAMPIFSLFKDVVQLQAASGLTYTPTLIVGYGGPTGLTYCHAQIELSFRAKLSFRAQRGILGFLTGRPRIPRSARNDHFRKSWSRSRTV